MTTNFEYQMASRLNSRSNVIWRTNFDFVLNSDNNLKVFDVVKVKKKAKSTVALVGMFLVEAVHGDLLTLRKLGKSRDGLSTNALEAATKGIF